MVASIEQWRLTPPPGDSPALDAGVDDDAVSARPTAVGTPLAGLQVVSPPSLRSMLQPLGACTCQCRGHGFEPWSGKIPHAAEQLSPCATTTEPVR